MAGHLADNGCSQNRGELEKIEDEIVPRKKGGAISYYVIKLNPLS
jgi:hypothetical protein